MDFLPIRHILKDEFAGWLMSTTMICSFTFSVHAIVVQYYYHVTDNEWRVQNRVEQMTITIQENDDKEPQMTADNGGLVISGSIPHLLETISSIIIVASTSCSFTSSFLQQIFQHAPSTIFSLVILPSTLSDNGIPNNTGCANRKLFAFRLGNVFSSKKRKLTRDKVTASPNK